MSADLLSTFEQHWKDCLSPPDVFSFLRQHTACDSVQILAVILSDQQRRWLTDKPLRVEDYLAGIPDLPGDFDWNLQLAIGEFQARRETACPLNIHEISLRFPDLSDTLQDLLRELASGDQAPATPSVGLIYGPSGCGKSSLVKAGLLPHLSKDIVAVYVEATAEDTLAALRRGTGPKVVIIIDQFEQWLHSHRAEPEQFDPKSHDFRYNEMSHFWPRTV